MARILILETEVEAGTELQRLLIEEGFEAERALTFHEALDRLQAAAVFDVMLLSDDLFPGEMPRQLKILLEFRPKMSIFVLAHRQDEDSAVEALTSGAMDYIRRPFSPRELLERIRAALRMSSLMTPQLRCGDLLLKMDQRRLLFRQSEIAVKRREFDILSFFLRNKGLVVSRESLISALDRESEMLHRTIDTHVSHLRRKLRGAGVTFIRITSVYGVGYRLDGERDA